MKILSIGNSFSNDAQRYIHRISLANGKPIKTVNLYIGGCSLRQHYFNILENARAYDFQFNGDATGLKVSIKDALMSDRWDYVTLQQASVYSVNYNEYAPYLSIITECVKKYAPTAKLVVHQTWAYDEEVLLQRKNAESVEDMYNKLTAAYDKMAEEIGAEFIIPSGKAVASVIKNGIAYPYRDGFHMSIVEGRLLIGLLWYCKFTGMDVNEVCIPTLDGEISDENIAIIRKTVAEVLAI